MGLAGGGTRRRGGQLFEAQLEEKHHLSLSHNELADDIQISPVGSETLGLPRSMPSTLATEESEHGYQWSAEASTAQVSWRLPCIVLSRPWQHKGLKRLGKPQASALWPWL